jgi:hypothetical protein
MASSSLAVSAAYGFGLLSKQPSSLPIYVLRPHLEIVIDCGFVGLAALIVDIDPLAVSCPPSGGYGRGFVHHFFQHTMHLILHPEQHVIRGVENDFLKVDHLV